MICLPEFYLFNLREADHTKFFYTENFLLVVWLVSPHLDIKLSSAQLELYLSKSLVYALST